MNFLCKRAIAIILLISSFATPVAAEPFEDAAAAYGKGDYATAAAAFSSVSRSRHGESPGHSWRDVR